MKLHEFHVTEFRSGSRCQSDAICGRRLEIRRVAINLSHRAGGQQNCGTRDFVGNPFCVEHRNASHAPIFRCYASRERALLDANVFQRIRLRPQNAENFRARRLSLRMQKPSTAVAALRSKKQLCPMRG
jgi:hypothetical protein